MKHKYKCKLYEPIYTPSSFSPSYFNNKLLLILLCQFFRSEYLESRYTLQQDPAWMTPPPSGSLMLYESFMMCDTCSNAHYYK